MGLYRRPDSPYWWMSVRAPGRPRRLASTGIPHGAPAAAQRAELKRQAQAIFAREQATEALARHGLTPRPPRSVADHLAWYELHVTAHKRGAAREREILARLRADLGPLPLTALTTARVLEWRSARRTHVAASTVNRELDVLKHALTQAVPTYLEASPIARLPRLYAPATEAAVLAPRDETKILAVLRPPDRAIVIAALDTLLRASELLALEWTHVTDTALLVVNPKAGPPRQVPISKRLRRALTALPRRGRYVFAHRRHAKTARARANSLKQMLEDACQKAAVRYGRGRGITFHALRHTGASRMVAAGTDLRTVQALGGWSSMRMLTRYLHPSPAASRAAVEAVGRGVAVTSRLRSQKRTRKTA